MVTEALIRQSPEGEETKHVSPDLRVFWVRHGHAEYTEEDIDGNIDGHLDDRGISQVQTTAQKLSEEFDGNDLVVFLVSPKGRAQETSGILAAIFFEKEIPIYINRPYKSLRDVRFGPVFVNLFKTIPEVGRDVLRYWLDHPMPEDTEPPDRIGQRVEHTVAYLERISRATDIIKPLQNKRLNIVCVGHGELFRDLLVVSGLVQENFTEPECAEVMEMNIYKSIPGIDARLELTFRGQQAELRFNPPQKRFFYNRGISDPQH